VKLKCIRTSEAFEGRDVHIDTEIREFTYKG
jgi:hypothetical protein